MTCSQQSLHLPAWGTAPVARFWVALEQPGPWGAKALTQSRLDPELGQRLSSLVERAGGRLVLIRNPRQHVAEGERPRTVLVAGGSPGSPWLGRTVVRQPQELERLLTEWLQGGDEAPPSWAASGEPVLLVCANGKRDQCCAVKARPVLRSLPPELAGRVWESSHLNGHRFATTALALPSSQLVARLDAALAPRLLDGSAPLPLGPEQDRGRTLLAEPLQVADAWLRARDPHRDPSRLRFLGPDETDLVTVTDASDGSQHRVRVVRRTLEQQLPKSCGKPAEPAVVWQAEPA